MTVLEREPVRRRESSPEQSTEPGFNARARICKDGFMLALNPVGIDADENGEQMERLAAEVIPQLS